MDHNAESTNFGFVNNNSYKALQADSFSKSLSSPLPLGSEGRMSSTYQKISLYIGENWLYIVENEQAVADQWVF